MKLIFDQIIQSRRVYILVILQFILHSLSKTYHCQLQLLLLEILLSSTSINLPQYLGIVLTGKDYTLAQLEAQTDDLLPQSRVIIQNTY